MKVVRKVCMMVVRMDTESDEGMVVTMAVQKAENWVELKDAYLAETMVEKMALNRAGN